MVAFKKFYDLQVYPLYINYRPPIGPLYPSVNPFGYKKKVYNTDMYGMYCGVYSDGKQHYEV